jgi:DNA-binding MarR family transcriptional regulator
MVKEGLIRFELNRHHNRAKLVLMTDRGRRTFSAAMARQHPWVAKLADGLSTRKIEEVLRVLRELRLRLE